MDALMLFLARQIFVDYEKVQICDTTLHASLVKHHCRLVRTAVKDRPEFKFSGVYCESIISQLPERIYFPFNIDQQHWVGVCIDTKASTVNVLGCNVAFKSYSLMKKEFSPVANLMPYIVKVANGVKIHGSQKPFTLNRAKGVPHIARPADVVVLSILLIEAHAKSGPLGINISRSTRGHQES
ncbi:hypothetical protein N665_0101s0002 [Sinapis alba]|nr:hypothetical protein N665_0101s0002 [Sinapis alba]